MKAYVITQGEYSDKHIVHITTDKKKAERYIEYNNARYVDRYYWGNCYLEEYEIDDFEVDDTPIEKVNTWNIDVYDNGKIQVKRVCMCHREESRVEDYHCYTKPCFYSVVVFTDDESEEKAKKIAVDLVAKYKAEQEGI